MALGIITTAADSVNAAIVPLAGEGGYTPDKLAADLAAGVPTILAWVGAGVGGGIVLMLAFMGIRKGFAFFKGIGK